MRRFCAALAMVLFVACALHAADDDVTWNGLHVTRGSPFEFIYPFDGRTPKVAATLHNHHDVDSPAVMVKSIKVNGQPIDVGTEISSAGPLVIPPDQYALPSISSAGVYDGRFGTPPAIGETKTYHFEFEFMLAPGVTPSDPAAGPSTAIIQDVKFTNLGDAPSITGPNVYSGVLRVPPPAVGATVTNPRVEISTPYSAWVNIPLSAVAGSGGTAFSFTQGVALRNDWYLRYSADGYESRVVWLGYYTFPAPPLDLTLTPAATMDADYRRATAITTVTGFWRGAVSDSEGTFVVFPGQDNWKATTTDADARALRAAGKIAKYRFDGSKVWEISPGWETWAGDMSADGRYVAYVPTPISRSFYTPTENKLVLLDGANGNPIWTKSAAPSDTVVGRKIESIEVRFSPDARWLAVGSMTTGQVTLIDRATGNFVWTVPNSGFGFGAIYRLVFSPDGQFLYAGSADGAVRQLRVSDGSVVWRALANAAPELNGLNVSPDGTWLAIGSRSQDATIVRTTDGLMKWQLATESADTAMAPDGRFVASDGGQIFNTLTGALSGFTKATGLARFTTDGHNVVQLGRDFRVYDLGGKLLKTFESSGIGTPAGEDPKWSYLTRDGRYAIVLARDMLNPPEMGIVIYERRTASGSTTVPTITAPPIAQTVTAGGTVNLVVGATGTPPLAYHWQRNGADIVGANSAALSLGKVAAADAGTYTAIVSNAAGSATSSAALVAVVNADAANPARIANLSVLSTVSAAPVIVGFAVGGPGTNGSKPLLIRGTGPALTTFGVTDPVRDPKITLFSGTTTVQANDNWAGNAPVAAMAAQVGAFPLTNVASTDAGIVLTSNAGSYSVHLASSDGSVGTGLAEIYDGTAAFTASTPRLTNISALTATTPNNVLTAGFVVSGPAAKTVLIRGVGPTLTGFGVTGTLADSQLTLFRGGVVIATNDNWYDAPNALQIASAAEAVGAFTLDTTSRDAAMLISLPPGSYTVQVTGANGTSGAALIEVYDVP